MQDVCLQMSALTILSNDLCHERVRTTSHLRRPTVDAALDGVLCTKQPSQPQSRSKRFRETANAQHLLAIRQRIEAGRHCTFKREIAIDIIFYNHEVILGSQSDNLTTSRFNQSAARWIVKVRNGIEEAREFTARA